MARASSLTVCQKEGGMIILISKLLNKCLVSDMKKVVMQKAIIFEEITEQQPLVIYQMLNFRNEFSLIM